MHEVVADRALENVLHALFVQYSGGLNLGIPDAGMERVRLFS